MFQKMKGKPLKGVDARPGTRMAEARPDRSRTPLKGEEKLRHATLQEEADTKRPVATC